MPNSAKQFETTDNELLLGIHTLAGVKDASRNEGGTEKTLGGDS